MNANLGYIYLHGRRYPEAIAQLHKAAELNADFSYTPMLLGMAPELDGNLTEAIKEYEKAYTIEKVDELNSERRTSPRRVPPLANLTASVRQSGSRPTYALS